MIAADQIDPITSVSCRFLQDEDHPIFCKNAISEFLLFKRPNGSLRKGVAFKPNQFN